MTCTLAFPQEPYPPGVCDYASTLRTPAGSGSCFFVCDSPYVYVVTARHVLFYDTMVGQPRQWQLRSTEASVFGNDAGARYEYALHLGTLYLAGRIRVDSFHDVAVVRVGDVAGPCAGGPKIVFDRRFDAIVLDEGAPYAGPKGMLKKYDEVEVGSDILVLGYPTSLGLKRLPQLDYDLPLAHRGIIAGKNLKNHTIVMDVAVYPGNSGGPVVGTEVINSVRWYVPVGIVTQYVPFDESRHNMTLSRKNKSISTTSSYSIAEPLDPVIDILNSWK